jgi:hypothetical protein
MKVLWDVTPCQLPLTTSQYVISPEDLNFMNTGVRIPSLEAKLIILFYCVGISVKYN